METFIRYDRPTLKDYGISTGRQATGNKSKKLRTIQNLKQNTDNVTSVSVLRVLWVAAE